MPTYCAWQYTTQGRLSGTVTRVTRSRKDEVEDDEVLIQVKAAAVNPVDEQLAQSGASLLRFMGADPLPSDLTPWVPANDFSGVVKAAGVDSGYKVGDEVYGMKPFGPVDGDGTLQEYITAKKDWPMVPKPAELSFSEAAALPLVYMTVYDALINYGRLEFNPPPEQRGKRSVLILGGSSGTGSVAVQLGKKMGLNVVATCSTRNVEFVKSLGADEVIDYKQAKVVDSALFSHYAPYALVLDCVGGKEVVEHIDHLLLDDPKAPHLGIYVTIVGDKTGRDAMGGAITNYFYPAQAIRTFRGRLRDTLPWWTPFKSWIAGKRYACIMLQPSREMLESVPEFLASAKNVIIDSTWSFEDVPKAYAKLESGRAVGKVVVEVSS
ncbi:hypothetical protein DB88DRAFT_488047 [Papiliotrema laurentii]|uniref:Enoyl reductase (ER) domain-containing protein n=1 Tax=Papiliotrema laurentii TaxID=5418 RepID=A0AAD9L745_PAPLA|nr:hypothetical protein DB88DRAFT_488047 [Papiliotrema laurentii]